MALGTFCCHVWYCETMSALLTSGACQHWEWGANKRKYDTHTLSHTHRCVPLSTKPKYCPQKVLFQDSTPQTFSCTQSRHFRGSFCLHSVSFAVIKLWVSRVPCNQSSKTHYHPAFAVITIFLITSLEEWTSGRESRGGENMRCRTVL